MAIDFNNFDNFDNGVDSSFFCRVFDNSFTDIIYPFVLPVFLITLISLSLFIFIKRNKFPILFKYLKIFFTNLFIFVLYFFIIVFLESKFGFEDIPLFIVWFISYFFTSFFIYKKEKSKNIFFIIGFIVSSILLIIGNNKYYDCYSGGFVVEKPIIYLYPEIKQDINIELDIKGKLIADYPDYNGGWDVTAYPDGKIIHNGDEYSYLFWEALFDDNTWNIEEGFVVKGTDSKGFLKEKLPQLGLTPKEYNEFIVYWYPRMMNNDYNLIYFAGNDYTSRAQLDISPKPDSILRVFTVIKPLDSKIDIPEQKLEKFDRKGFSVVEWGGVIID